MEPFQTPTGGEGEEGVEGVELPWGEVVGIWEERMPGDKTEQLEELICPQTFVFLLI